MSTNLTLSAPYMITVTAGTCGGNFTKYGKAYVDWNHDFDFLDAFEEIAAFGPAPATNTFITNFNVPGGALLGPTRLRVVVMETSSLAGLSSCGNFTWGETEDYTVNVMPSSPNDIGVSSIVSPNSGCSLSCAEQIQVTVSNFGTNTQTAWNVHYRVNGGPIVTEPMSASLPLNGSVNYTFLTPASLCAAGNYTIKAWTTLVGDGYIGNDSTTKIVTSIPSISTFPYIEDFEAGNGGWLPGGTSNTWTYGTPAKPTINSAASGTKAYVTGGLGAGQYSNSEQSYVLGPCFNLSALQNPWVSTSIWWASEFSWDGTNLQYSTNFGTTWQNVGLFNDPGNWYNDNSIVGTPGGSSEGWTGGAFGNTNGSGGYVTAAHRLDGLAGVSSVRFRMTFASDASVTADGVAFDDFKIAEGPVCNLGPDQLLCGGDTLVLDAGPFATFLWSPGGQTTRYKNVTQANTGMHIVRVTDVFGFYDFDTVIVSLSNPSLNIGPDSSICPGDTVHLDAGPHNGATYVWQDNSTNQTFPATTQGVFYVEITDSAGCQKTDSMHLNIYTPPSLSLGNDTTVCSNSPVVLDAGNGPTGTDYLWNTSSVTQVLVVTAAGAYSASVTTPGGCTAVDTIVINHFPTPGVNLGPNFVACGPYTLDAGAGGTSYIWSTGANTQSINSSTAGTFGVTVTNSFGCHENDNVSVTMGVVPVVSLGPDRLLCNAQTAVLDAGNSGSTYLWSTGATTQTITVSTGGTYIVNVTNPQGCVGRDTMEINVSGLLVNLGPNTNICDNGSYTMDAGNPGMVYVWSTGATTQTISTILPGTYSVTVTDNIGCSAGDVIILTQVPGVYGGIGSPSTANLFFPVSFTDNSTGGPTTWQWLFGDGLSSNQQNPTHTYAALGNYTVTLIVSDGFCRDTVTTQINVNSFVSVADGDFATAFDLYPNPSSGVFHLYLELLKRSDLEIAVMDLHGRTVYSEQVRRAQTYQGDIDLSALSKGVYVLSLQAGDHKIYHKLVIQ